MKLSKLINYIVGKVAYLTKTELDTIRLNRTVTVRLYHDNLYLQDSRGVSFARVCVVHDSPEGRDTVIAHQKKVLDFRDKIQAMPYNNLLDLYDKVLVAIHNGISTMTVMGVEYSDGEIEYILDEELIDEQERRDTKVKDRQ